MGSEWCRPLDNRSPPPSISSYNSASIGNRCMKSGDFRWRSSVAFGGLVYALGGRSLYFGGWSPRYLSSEMHASAVGAFTQDTLWPSSVIQDLQVRYFAEAEDQTDSLIDKRLGIPPIQPERNLL